MSLILRFRLCAVLIAVCVGLSPLMAVAQSGARFEKIRVHAHALEGNLAGESADRDVIVYLPADYATNPDRRYPVVYGLHGYAMDAESFAGLLQTPKSLDAARAQGLPGVILVLPDSRTLHNGSMYSSSITIGDWEGFITRDLVAYIDAHYRTLPERRSRGLMGHSMGGYGAVRLGMKYPDVFGALYIMSPCCLSAREAPPAPVAAEVENTRTREAAVKLDFLQRATFAVAAAWSPNPHKPPFFVDLPTNKGAVDKEVLARWAANAPLAMLDQYVFNLRRYPAIAMDVGDEDGFRIDAAELHRRLTDSGVNSRFAIYPGDHGNRIGQRFETHVLPFFAETLDFGPEPGRKP